MHRHQYFIHSSVRLCFNWLELLRRNAAFSPCEISFLTVTSRRWRQFATDATITVNNGDNNNNNKKKKKVHRTAGIIFLMSLQSNPAPDIHYAAMEMWNALKTSPTDCDACQLRSDFMRHCVILDDPELQSDVHAEGSKAVMTVMQQFVRNIWRESQMSAV